MARQNPSTIALLDESLLNKYTCIWERVDELNSDELNQRTNSTKKRTQPGDELNPEMNSTRWRTQPTWGRTQPIKIQIFIILKNLRSGDELNQ